VPLRLPAPAPRSEQIYFIGATNVPLERPGPGIDPARPHGPPYLVSDADEGRPDRHLRPLSGKVDHEPDLDTDRRRDELARITNGYSRP